MATVLATSRSRLVLRTITPPLGRRSGRALLLACTLALAGPAKAQTAGEGPIVGQALIVESDGKLHCGIATRYNRGTGADRQRVALVSASIRVDSLHGTVVSDFAASDFLPAGDVEQIMRSTRVMPVDSGWITAPGAGNATTAGRAPEPLHPVDGARHTVALGTGMPVLTAMLAGEPIEIGVRIAGRAAPIARTGIVLISDPDRRKVQSCLDVALAKPGS